MRIISGPALSGFIVHAFGFPAMLYVISFLCLCYAPLLFWLRNPPAREEKMVKESLDENSFHPLIDGFPLFCLVADYERKSQFIFIYT